MRRGYKSAFESRDLIRLLYIETENGVLALCSMESVFLKSSRFENFGFQKNLKILYKQIIM